MTNEEPLRRRKKSTFTNVGNVLNNLVTNLGLDRRLREQALMKLWPLMAGDAFARSTRALFIDYENNLVVAVQDASVAQELSFHKRQLTNRLKGAGQSTGIRIEGMRFDLKRFNEASANHAEADDYARSSEAATMSEPATLTPTSKFPDEETLTAVDLSEVEIDEITELKSEIIRNGKLLLDDPAEDAISTLSQRIGNLVERELRLRKWQQVSGFPNCHNCRLPSTRLHAENGLCAYCYLKQTTN